MVSVVNPFCLQVYFSLVGFQLVGFHQFYQKFISNEMLVMQEVKYIAGYYYLCHYLKY